MTATSHDRPAARLGARRTRLALGSAAAVVSGLALCLPAGVSAARETTTAHQATTVTVLAGSPSEFRFKLSKASFPHGVVTFKITNRGTLPHDFKVCASSKGTAKPNSCVGTGTKQIAPKKTATFKYTFKTKGTYEYICTVPGHAVAGMKGTVKVT